MAKKKRGYVQLDVTVIERLLDEYKARGVNVKPLIQKLLTNAGKKVQADTRNALDDQYLPRQGVYHREGRPTEKSVADDPVVRWDGDVAWIPVGFDFQKERGAGGYLISGTPRMKPDKELNKMYRGKAYMGSISRWMWDLVAAMLEVPDDYRPE